MLIEAEKRKSAPWTYELILCKITKPTILAVLFHSLVMCIILKVDCCNCRSYTVAL